MNYIDLFAGAGGLSEGFIRNGFEPIAHVEMDEAACYTLKTRAAYHYLTDANEIRIYHSYLKGEITREDLYSEIPDEILESIINLPIGAEYNERIYRKIDSLIGNEELDLIIGGPPCQAYSLVGRARSENGMVGDKRNYLYVAYAKFLEKYRPKMFIFENVVGLKSAGGGVYLKNMERLFNKKGYKINLFELDSKNFDVLQHRKRIIIMGWRDDFVPNLPNLEGRRTETGYFVGDIFSDLPEIHAGEGNDKYMNYRSRTTEYLNEFQIRNGINILTQHLARPHSEQDRHIYRIAVEKWSGEGIRLNYNDLPDNLKSHSNRHSFLDRFKVVAANHTHSHTVVAHIAKDGHYYIHPDIEQNRSITVREAARLQSFPDNYYFEGVKEGSNRTAAFKQIGNAVPPLMAELIAEPLIDIV